MQISENPKKSQKIPKNTIKPKMNTKRSRPFPKSSKEPKEISYQGCRDITKIWQQRLTQVTIWNSSDILKIALFYICLFSFYHKKEALLENYFFLRHKREDLYFDPLSNEMQNSWAWQPQQRSPWLCHAHLTSDNPQIQMTKTNVDF